MDTPLNLAHRHQRKAEVLIKVGKFDEAIQHHIAAEKALSEVVTTTESPHILQSLKLQREYHIRQQAVVKRKKEFAEIYKKYQDKVKEVQFKAIDNILSTPKYDSHNTASLIKKAIHAAVVHDSLINGIISSETQNVKKEPLSRSVDSIVKSAIKMPKDDKSRLEELRISNNELKRLVFILVTNLEKLHLENSTLKALLEETVNDRKRVPVYQPNVACQSLCPLSTLHPLSTELKNVDNVCDLPALASVEIPNCHSSEDSESDKTSGKGSEVLSVSGIDKKIVL